MPDGETPLIHMSDYLAPTMMPGRVVDDEEAHLGPQMDRKKSKLVFSSDIYRHNQVLSKVRKQDRSVYELVATPLRAELDGLI